MRSLLWNMSATARKVTSGVDQFLDYSMTDKIRRVIMIRWRHLLTESQPP